MAEYLLFVIKCFSVDRPIDFLPTFISKKLFLCNRLLLVVFNTFWKNMKAFFVRFDIKIEIGTKLQISQIAN